MSAAAGLLFPVAVLLNGFAVSRLWGWFVAPEFGLPRISSAQGFGIALLAAVLTHQWNGQGSDDHDVERVLYDVATPVLALAIGWMTKAWWM